ncbi:MAG: CocE/NonD family hydrolase [Gemmatimonadaceae bacterium]
MTHLRLLQSLVLGLAFVPAVARAQTPAVPAAEKYERRELSIPMRDGTKLFAIALIPTRTGAPLPIILTRTPFGAERAFRNTDVPNAYRELAEDGYVFVSQDIRGRFRSGGTFVSLRAQNDPRNAKGTNESTDAYDTIDWLVKNLPNNSAKVGVMGMSYSGWLAAMAGVNPHPALKAIHPQAPVGDAWLGDDFFHQGAFRQTQAVTYASYIEGDGSLTIPDYDQYSFYLRQKTLAELGKVAGVDTIPIWVASRTHPARDSFWNDRAIQNVLTTPEVPTLTLSGAWDEEDMLGAQITYRTLERHDKSNWNRFVIGPWYHTQWVRPGGDSLGPIALGSKTADYFRNSIMRPWFAHYLHGKGDSNFPEAWAFESGSNTWRTFDAWPPRNAEQKKLFLRENGVLSFEAPKPTSATSFDAFTADPAHPVPYMPRPDNGEEWHTWMQQDQRFVDNRPDVLTWTSAPLTEDLTIGGEVAAHLFASTTGTDADWVVKLMDVYPDSVGENSLKGGYQLIVNADIMRGRYWKSFSTPAPIPARIVTPFNIMLHDQLYRFKKGHRLMVQVQSTWFPLYDRNPQTFVPNIFNAMASDFRPQEHRVWRSTRYPSHLTIPVLPTQAP